MQCYRKGENNDMQCECGKHNGECKCNPIDKLIRGRITYTDVLGRTARSKKEITNIFTARAADAEIKKILAFYYKINRLASYAGDILLLIAALVCFTGPAECATLKIAIGLIALARFFIPNGDDAIPNITKQAQKVFDRLDCIDGYKETIPDEKLRNAIIDRQVQIGVELLERRAKEMVDATADRFPGEKMESEKSES